MKITAFLPVYCLGTPTDIGEMMFNLGNSVMNPLLSRNLRGKIATWMNDARIVKGFKFFSKCDRCQEFAASRLF